MSVRRPTKRDRSACQNAGCFPSLQGGGIQILPPALLWTKADAWLHPLLLFKAGALASGGIPAAMREEF
jgi:hypothetical protein